MNLIYLPADNSPLDFVAYYPYIAGLENNIYTVDVSDQSDQSAIDLMAADWESADRISAKVNFVHKLSKTVINLEPGKVTVIGVSLRIWICSSSVTPPPAVCKSPSPRKFP